MTHQRSFSRAGFAAKKKTTRREKFQSRMEEVIPWSKLQAVIGPHYPQGGRGPPPVGLERMLRVYFLQQWYGLADEAIGVEKRAEIVALERKIDWQIARKRGKIKVIAEGAEKETLKAMEKAKASVRAFVEHPFHILKNIFRHRKVWYRGLAKNGHQLHTLSGLANVVPGARTTAT